MHFTPTQLIHQVAQVFTLELRPRRTNDDWMSASQFWQNHSQRDIMTRAPVNVQFRLSSCCEGQGNNWAGSLTY